jgi:hypothetical protein
MHSGAPRTTQETPGMHSRAHRSTQEAPSSSQERPGAHKKHPGATRATQETPRRHPGSTQNTPTPGRRAGFVFLLFCFHLTSGCELRNLGYKWRISKANHVNTLLRDHSQHLRPRENEKSKGKCPSMWRPRHSSLDGHAGTMHQL